MGRSDYLGQLGRRPPTTGGDGDGDGDCCFCEPVERTLVENVIFDSLGRMTLGNGATPLPIAWPASGAPAQRLAQWTTGPVMGGSILDPVNGIIQAGRDAGFEATLNMDIEKTGNGNAKLRVECFADYTGVVLPLEQWNFGIGSSGSDELVGVSFETLVPAESAVPGATALPQVYWEITTVSGNATGIQSNRASFYLKQCLPIVERVTINNCETASEPVACPTIDVTRVSVGGGPFVDFVGTIPVGAGAPIVVVSTLSGPLPSAITASNPPGAVYNPATPPGPSTPGGATITWSYNSPPGIVNVTADTATCEYDLGAVTDGTP